jgi:hypothetical protein
MAVKNSIKVGPFVFLLSMFVITENIMKRPVYDVYVKSVKQVSCSSDHTTLFVGRGMTVLHE